MKRDIRGFVASAVGICSLGIGNAYGQAATHDYAILDDGASGSNQDPFLEFFSEDGSNASWIWTRSFGQMDFAHNSRPFLRVTNEVNVDTLRLNEFGLGIGTTSPMEMVHVESDGSPFDRAQVLVRDTQATAERRELLRLENNGDPSFVFQDLNNGGDTEFRLFGDSDAFVINHITGGVAGPEFRLDRTGDVTIAGALMQNSDVTTKTAIVAVLPNDVLKTVEALPISTWQYKTDDPETRHLGPMAQDFHAAFGLGPDETKIAPADMAGVALAAIQAQQKDLTDKDQQIAHLQHRVAELEGLEARFTAIEAQLSD